ncbi:hypothetical protein HOY80DRAFT_43640 [Tuber brumale]|nr:hypothetical protein HOY80DRAFT_43640 [Tuber brumale]
MISQKAATPSVAAEISAMASPTSPTYPCCIPFNYTPIHLCVKWQECLATFCKQLGIGEPSYQEFSDPRGGRTAWTVVATLQPQFSERARFYYDVAFINNAREDAAEVSVKFLEFKFQPAQAPLLFCDHCFLGR